MLSPSFVPLSLSLSSFHLVSSRLVSVPVFVRSSLLGSRASRVISRPCFSFYLLLPSSTSGLDSPVTHSQSVPRSEKALRAPPFIVRVFAGPPINRLAARCPRPLSSPPPCRAFSRVTRALVIAFKVDRPTKRNPNRKIRPLSFFLPSLPFLSLDDRSIPRWIASDFPPIQPRLTTTTTTTTLPTSNWYSGKHWTFVLITAVPKREVTNRSCARCEAR